MGWGMMNWGGNMPYGVGYGWGFGVFAVTLTWVVWTIVGILVIAWLWKQIKK